MITKFTVQFSGKDTIWETWLCVVHRKGKSLVISVVISFQEVIFNMNCVKKNQLYVQLILSIFRQPLRVSAVSTSIVRRYNSLYTTVGTYYSFLVTLCCPGWVPTQPGQQTEVWLTEKLLTSVRIEIMLSSLKPILIMTHYVYLIQVPNFPNKTVPRWRGKASRMDLVRACWFICPLLPVGTNYGNILIPSEHTSIRHTGSTATAGLAIVRKIIYLTKSEILYGECSGGGGIPLLLSCTGWSYTPFSPAAPHSVTNHKYVMSL